MLQDQFEKTEAEYFRLRGQLAAGRISKQQFEAALKGLVFQDAQGRSWMLGADSGKWYAHDGRAWVEAQPPMSASSTSTPVAAPIARTESRGSRKILLGAAGCVCFTCLAAIVGMLGALGLGLLRIDVRPASRATPLPAIGYVLPSPTFGLSVKTAPTSPPFLVQTSTSTVTPAAAATSTRELSVPTPTVPAMAATPTITPEPFTPTPIIAPGVYVTDLRLEPPSPKRREDVGFYPTFLNTTVSEQNYRWLVYVYRADNFRHSLGETPKSAALFPVGATEQRANGTWKLTGGGECENFVARVAWINQDNQPIPFTKPDGQMYELPFSVCP